MYDIDAEVRGWRERQERTSSLSPRELDELEDHLRAGVDLELELNATLAPTRAFAIARWELGESAALSREFTKVGKRRWKRLLVAGWTLYVLTAVLPIPAIRVGEESFFGYAQESFQDLFLKAFAIDGVLGLIVNLAMFMTVPALWGARFSCGRWLRRFLGTLGLGWLAAGVGSLGYSLIRYGSWSYFLIPPGFWTWSGSYACVAVALWLRAREWAPATPKRVSP